MSAFSLFLHSYFFFHTHKGTHIHMCSHTCTGTHRVSPRPELPREPLNAPVYGSVLGSLFQTTAVKSQCLNATKTVWAPALFRGIYYGLSSGSLQPFTSLGQPKGAISTQLSVQRSPQPAAHGLWHLPPNQQQGGEARVPLLSEVLLGIWIQRQKQPSVALMESTQKVQMRFIGVQ